MVADGDRRERVCERQSFRDGAEEQKEMQRASEQMSVRKPLSRFRQLEKIDHRKPQRGSSWVTAAAFHP